jgi:aminoglycoside adenylyltransferase-like protein
VEPARPTQFPELNAILAELRGLGRKWLYIDHGWREMQWSTHCNTEVVRWSLREHGVTLAGPDPRTLVDEVPAAVLRARMRSYAREFLPDMLDWIGLDVAWGQRYTVTTYCRILHALDTSQVTSKRAAARPPGRAAWPRRWPSPSTPRPGPPPDNAGPG